MRRDAGDRRAQVGARRLDAVGAPFRRRACWRITSGPPWLVS